ncbi:MAG: hypothetical protein C0606_05195 [Hyphomicrobiales bacterium]|nr:MAG: hypothetical protein C0606_05195 [Hyphomicrobiales bacterium]
MIDLINQTSLTLESARVLAGEALRQAKAIGKCMHVTIVDAAGHVLVYQRMPGAPYPGREFSEKKAYTAVSFKKSTAVWKDRLAENPHLAAGLSQHPDVAMIGGGLPITIDGAVVGAIGIAGGLEEDDITVAEATLEAFGL